MRKDAVRSFSPGTPGLQSFARQARVENATAEELDRYIERVLTADSLEAVLNL